MSGNNIGLVCAALDAAAEAGDNFVLSPAIFLKQRAVGCGIGDLTEEQSNFMRRILAIGEVDCEFSKAPNEIKDLIRKGHVVVKHDLRSQSKNGALVKFDPAAKNRFTFGNALQVDYLHTQGVIPQTQRTWSPRTAFECLFFALPHLPASALMAAAHDPNSAAELLEAPLQHGLSLAFDRAGIYAIAEFPVRSHNGPGRPHAVDFVLFPPATGRAAIEILTDGTWDIHCDRFSTSYASFKSNYVVARFLARALTIADVPPYSNTCLIGPHPSFGWGVLHVKFKNAFGDPASEWFVPRLGVPYKLDMSPARSIVRLTS